MVAPLVIGAILAAAQTEQQRQQMKQQQAMEAGKARYSPWTGMKPDTGNIHAPTTVSNFGSSMLTMQDMADKNPGMFGGNKGTMEGAVPAAAGQVPMASAGGTGAAGAPPPMAPGGNYGGGVANAITGAPGAAGAKPPQYAGPMRPPMQPQQGSIWDLLAQMRQQQNPQG